MLIFVSYKSPFSPKKIKLLGLGIQLMVECFPTMHKVLDSIPSSAKKRKKKRNINDINLSSTL